MKRREVKRRGWVKVSSTISPCNLLYHWFHFISSRLAHIKYQLYSRGRCTLYSFPFLPHRRSWAHLKRGWKIEKPRLMEKPFLWQKPNLRGKILPLFGPVLILRFSLAASFLSVTTCLPPLFPSLISNKTLVIFLHIALSASGSSFSTLFPLFFHLSEQEKLRDPFEYRSCATLRATLHNLLLCSSLTCGYYFCVLSPRKDGDLVGTSEALVRCKWKEQRKSKAQQFLVHLGDYCWVTCFWLTHSDQRGFVERKNIVSLVNIVSFINVLCFKIGRTKLVRTRFTS